jgi:hypothetical protein
VTMASAAVARRMLRIMVIPKAVRIRFAGCSTESRVTQA